MKLKLILFSLITLFLTTTIFADDTLLTQSIDSTKSTTVDNSEQFIVYYLHMNRRCVTCKKLEAYSEEAIALGFSNQLNDSSLVWKSINFEDEGNEHFAKTYQLYSQSLVISKLKDGKETDWKNLDKIWSLTDNKDKYFEYVQQTVKEFISPNVEATK